MLGIWDENEKQCCKMLYWYLRTCSPEGTCGRCLFAYPHFAGQFPHFSKCKALTIIQHIHVVCRKMLGALALGTKRASFQGLDSWPNHTAELVTSPSSGRKYWFPALPFTHIAPLSVLGRCVGSFWHVLDFYASTERQRWNSKDWFSPWNRKMWMLGSCTSKEFFANIFTGYLGESEEGQRKSQGTNSQIPKSPRF